MSTVNKEDYYTNNSSINMHIDNIISFRDFLNAVLTDIKSGEYNIHMIKNLSHTVEKFYNQIGDNDDIFKPSTLTQFEEKELMPKIVETYQESDSDVESDITIASGPDSDSDSIDYPGKKSAYNVASFFSHKPQDVQNDDPDFLDDYHSPSPSVSTPHNTPQNSSLMTSYSKLREPKVVQHDYYQELYEKHRQEVDENRKEHSSPLIVKFEKTEEDSDINREPSKPVDKLAEAFLNNNLELDKYHYLKNFNQDRINNFCQQSLIY
jgi:hypothetical protein